MKFSVIREHRRFFEQHHWIEFEGLLPASQLDTFAKDIPTICTIRLKSPEAKANSDQLFEIGRDIWRGAAALKKNVLSEGLAQIASELIEQRPLRIGYDQLLPSLTLGTPTNGLYHSFLQNLLSLQDFSGIQGVLCGLMLCLKAPKGTIQPAISTTELDPNTPEEAILKNIFPLAAGDGIYFAPDIPIDFSPLLSTAGGSYLLVVYVKSNAIYCRQDQDPLNRHFRDLGYDYGDKLSDRFNPLVYS